MPDEKLFYKGGQNLLIYQKEDWNSDFGIRVLSEVFINTDKEKPVEIAESLHSRFPQETYCRLPPESKYCQLYVPFGDMPPFGTAKILFNQTSAAVDLIHDSNFPYFGYLVDLASRKLHSIRGSDHLHMPPGNMQQTFTRGQKAFNESMAGFERSSFFPFKLTHTYSFDALPSLQDFESDLAQSSRQYLDDMRRLGL